MHTPPSDTHVKSNRTEAASDAHTHTHTHTHRHFSRYQRAFEKIQARGRLKRIYPQNLDKGKTVVMANKPRFKLCVGEATGMCL